MRTKKTSGKHARPEAKQATASAATRPTPEVPETVAAEATQQLPAAVLGSAWVAGISLEGGQANIAVRLDIPAPTMVENPKWPFTPWNVEQLNKQLQKDLRRVAQTIANSAYVRGLVQSRAAARAERRAVAASAQPQETAQATAAQ